MYIQYCMNTLDIALAIILYYVEKDNNPEGLIFENRSNYLMKIQYEIATLFHGLARQRKLFPDDIPFSKRIQFP